MDADYLKKNINAALMEGLTAMAVEIPEDDVEFLGKYLLEYASRQRKAEKIQAELLAVENKYADYVTSEEMKAKSAAEKDATASQKANAYSRFISDIQTVFNNKTDMMYSVVEYIEGQMDIPAAYIAIKTTVGENEILNYVVASPSQKFMEGKKLAKPPADEGEEAPPRQGIAFEAFKLPEVPEEEEAGDEETKVAKEPPKPLPVVIDNAMRDKRCKFFGIPKLGAFAAIPFTYQSVDHENGCIMSAGEEEKPAEYTINKMPIQFIIGIDSVGKYRIFKTAEIDKIAAIGNELIKGFEKIEESLGQAQLAYMNSEELKTFNEAVSAVQGTIADDEGRAIGTIAAPEGEAAEGVSELLKPYKEAEAVIIMAWNPAVGSGAVADGILTLSSYVLPLPAPAINLLYAVCCCVNSFDKAIITDGGGDPSWTKIKGHLSELVAAIAEYKPANPAPLKSTSYSIAAVKTLVESGNLSDPSIFPANLPIFALLSGWLMKAVAAREAALAYYAEAEKINLETYE